MDKTVRVNGLCPLVPKNRRYLSIVKYVIVMKQFITILILSLNVSANVHSQRIDLVVKNQPIREVLRSIGKQTGYNFLFESDLLDIAKPVTVSLKQARIEEALQEIMKDQLSPAQQKDISGMVQDENNNPLPGATVILKEQKNRITVTDGDGRFSFANAPDQGTILVRMIGWETRQIKYKNGNIISFVLKEANTNMEEMQIIAYGQVNKKYLTSNISSIKGNIIAQAPVTNVLYALEGRVPGLFIQQSSGMAGNAVNVTVQGKNSIQSGNLPFYVIDGVPYNPDVIPTNVRSGTTGIGSAIGFINPADIESVEILKDADATAIYGSRAANGAILITTKKGKAGLTKVDVNMQTGWGKISKKLDFLNTEQYLALRKEAYKNGGQPIPTNYDYNGNADLTVWDQSRSTDWQKELIGGTAQYQNISTFISGGNENTQFLAGGGYQRETTVFPGDFSNIKGSIHFNLNHSSLNKKFHFNLTTNYLNGTNRLPGADLTSAISLAPNAPALYNPDGTINWSLLPPNEIVATFDNPIVALKRTYTEKTNNLISSSNISYEIVSGLILKAGMGYNRLQSDEISISPLISFRPDYRSIILRSAKFANKNTETWIAEPQLTYDKDFSFGHIEALVGGTFQQTKNYMQSFNAQGFANDAQLENIQSASTVTVSDALQSTYKYSAVFGRLNYRYKDNYVLNLSMRRDGSSRFGSENLFHSFYSIGGAWIFSNENFVRNSLSFLNFGKLRASYGTTGNDQIGDYQFLDLYNYYRVGMPYQRIVTLSPGGLPNPYLQWEETKKLNLGLDLAFLNNRLTITANYFRNRSSNQLLNDILPAIAGFSYILRNLPAIVENKGWEFLLETNPIKAKNFNWQSSINLTIPKNKLIKYDNLNANSNYVIGQSLFLAKVYKYAGVNSETGLYQFTTSKGQLTSSPDGQSDRTVLIDLNPKWYGGFSNTITYKGWRLDFLLQYVRKNGQNYKYPSFPGNSNNNVTTNVLNHWRTPGDNAEIQKITINRPELLNPTRAINQSDVSNGDASYARLKNASLSYQLPALWLRKTHISQARIYIQGQNLLTFTKYYGADPETMAQGSLPLLRIYTLGMQFTL